MTPGPAAGARMADAGLAPRIETPRLVLRPFEPADAAVIQPLLDDSEVAANLLRTPFPYTRQDAEDWVVLSRRRIESGEGLPLAVERREASGVIGCVGLDLAPAHRRAELGYWIGRPYWGRGYATEAGLALVAHGFEALNLNRIHAGYYHWNPASRRVLEKLGMHPEGVQRAHVIRLGRTADLHLMGMTVDQWRCRSRAPSASPL